MKETDAMSIAIGMYDDGYSKGYSDAIDKCIKFVDEWDSVIADALAKKFKEQNNENI